MEPTMKVSLKWLLSMAAEARMTNYVPIRKAEGDEAFVELSNDDVWLVHKTGRRAYGKEVGGPCLTSKGYQKIGSYLWTAFNRANSVKQHHPGVTEADFAKFYHDQHTAVVDSTHRYLSRISKPKLLI